MDATFTAESNTTRRNHRKVIDLIAISTDKARAQTITCIAAMALTIVLALACWVCGILLPLWVENVTQATVWVSMGLELTGFALLSASRWINHNTLG